MVATTEVRTPPTPKIAYDVTEVARMLDVHRETVIESIRNADIRGFRLGGKGKWLVSRGEMARLVGCEPEELP